ncbi:MAG: AAA family ATPase [Saprospiraceae bacterium]|nr:AAA family ATPase [Saprospiraceae bacterium]
MMKNNIIGRKAETAVLRKALISDEAEMVAVFGRRRVGKTYLVRSVYGSSIKFEMTGIQKGNLREQLQQFTNRLNFHAKPPIPYQTPSNWLDAFQMLTLYFDSQSLEEKIVLFFDEVPWMATRKSDFLKAFGVFWNSWASQSNVVVVICGSAASWMIQKVVRDKGGLHNRITRRIHLQPFNLAETEAYLASKSCNLDRFQIIQLYMAMGGIPHYLKEVEAGLSAAQNIDRIFFSKSGLLHEEFGQLYAALFENAQNHVQIIRVLAEKWQGLTRKEIVEIGRFSNGGTITTVIEELEQSGFIQPYYTFEKQKKGIRYRLTDEYSMFYLHFIENKRLEEKGNWERFSQTQTWKIWTGYAFESLCLKHIPQIKKALGISGIYSEASTYRSQATDELPGIQVDLLIDRKDQVINLFELKFHHTEFIITKTYAQELRTKLAVFKANTRTKKQLFLTFLSSFGLLANEHSTGLVDRSLTMEVLFAEED